MPYEEQNRSQMWKAFGVIIMDTSLAEKGREFYNQNLKALLEPAENGKFVAIEPESGRYFVGKTTRETMDKAHREMPDKKFYLTRVGFVYAHVIKGSSFKYIYERKRLC
jgi:hypothetical protein